MNELTEQDIEKKVGSKNSLTAIKLRERLCDDKQISPGAVRLFVRLLDLSLNPWKNNGRTGQITIPQFDLGKLINCSDRSIRRYTQELIRGNYLWTVLVKVRTTKPLYCYHIMDYSKPDPTHQNLPDEGLRVNGSKRSDHGFFRKASSGELEPLPVGNEAGRQRRKGTGFVDQFGRPVFSVLLENSSVSGHDRPPLGVRNDRSERTESSSISGQNRPQTLDNNDRSQRSEMTPVSGQDSPMDQVGSVRHKRDSDRVKDGTKKGNPPPDAFADLLKGLYPSRLDQIKADLVNKLKKSNSDEAKREWNRRIKLVDEARLGGPVPDAPVKPKPQRKPPAPSSMPTKEQILDGARFLVTSGMEKSLTKGQIQALIEAGEWKGVAK